MKAYIIGSLRNPEVPLLAARLRQAGIRDVFDDWHAAGPRADDHWMEYEKARGHTFAEALEGRAAGHVFEYDTEHIGSSDAVVLLMPAGKSGHLEFGWAVGKGIPGYILMQGEPERFDVMYRFADQVYTEEDRLVKHLVSLQDDMDEYIGAHP